MRVVIFAAYYLPHIGGYTLDTHELAKGLVARGHSVDVVTCNTTHDKAKEIIDGVTVYRLPCWTLLNGMYPIPKPSWLWLKLLGRRYDIVSTQTRFFSTSLIGALYSLVKRIKLVHTERGTGHSVTPGRLVGALARLYDHTFGAFIIWTSAVSIGVSQATCGFIAHLCHKQAIEYIPNGVDDLFFRRRWLEGSEFVLFAGRLEYNKGVQDLIVACDGIPLVVVGDGGYRDSLRMLANGHADRQVKFLGSVCRQELALHLTRAGVFVNPSYSEGLPSSVAEAMTVGVPVIATDVGGTSELITDELDGYLVPAHDRDKLRSAIKGVLSNPSLTRRMSENSRRKMEQYRWSPIIERYEKLFRNISKNIT